MAVYRCGIDIGSTTVKLVLLDDNGKIIYGRYKRHLAKTRQTLKELVRGAADELGDFCADMRITGSGAISLAKALGIKFVQEVVATSGALEKYYPQTDVAIELGGEDAKIIYFKGGLDERMNGVCAGGTGAFIDQMAALLQTDADGLNEAAKSHKELYPIAARCGVFAKTDIQPLINEGAAVSDIAASVFQAVVNQTVSGLACGKPIRGTVAFLGGPLHYLPELKKAFCKTLKLDNEHVVDPENSHLFAALGAALEADGESGIKASELIKKLDGELKIEFELKRLPPLFTNEAQYREFLARHEKATLEKADLSLYKGGCYLGIDAGSTTTKMTLISDSGALLFSAYSNNMGDPVTTASKMLSELYEKLPDGAVIRGACSTGYGEALLKAAFRLDAGVVETVAHAAAAAHFMPDVDCVLDIGGQDMKCIRLKNGTVDTVLLNEACSSGCGSFIENFAASLGYTAEGFANEALFAKAPVDLGTRCTVFMNSNVKQAQKEGAEVSDISAGLAYSVIKNALFKVIKLSSASDLGRRVVVQGGTFCNKAVLRAFELVSGALVVCPDISGLMGAFGAALRAKEEASAEKSNMISRDELANLTYTTKTTHCAGCENRCLLTVSTFNDGTRHISGNRCERMTGKAGRSDVPNMFEYKRGRIFGYESLSEDEAPRGVIGIPRVLNIYENYPFWATFFKKLGFSVVLSPFSSRKIYELGMESIPSESECYPAKLAHGHVQWLIDSGVKTIFHPCVMYEYKETKAAENNYNCPIVVSYPENLKNNVEAVTDGDVTYLRPFFAMTSEKTASDRLVEFCKKTWNIPEKEARDAVSDAWTEMRRAKDDIRKEGARLISQMEADGRRGIVLAGRPYHIDAEINHSIPELINSYGLYVFTEDSLPYDGGSERPLRVVDQWVFHSRLYAAAEFVSKRDDLELIQLNSFGCGLDAVTTDQVCEILENSNKLYTVLKIDEVNNLGAARIRIRSLLAAMDMRRSCSVSAKPAPIGFERSTFTKEMYEQGYTILAPDMSPVHFKILGPVFKKYGYNVVMLEETDRKIVDTGLKYVNNDACYPSIVAVGQLMDAVLSGKYDTDKLALLMTQTGGCCRASNYVGFIRRALIKAGLPHIPVISLNFNNMEKSDGFKLTLPMLADGMRAIVYGDLIMKCLYRTRPYEIEKGSADALRDKWQRICIESLTGKNKISSKKLCQGIVEDFDNLPIDDRERKPRVGVVGEILVKYMPLANNKIVELLEREGAEAVVPDLLDFFAYYLYNLEYKHKYFGESPIQLLLSRAGIMALTAIRQNASNAIKNSRRFETSMNIGDVAELTKPFLSVGNQYGEGWFLAGEMAELISSGTPNVVCIQPFACLPNHVVGKGVIKQMKKVYPEANIAAVDYDPGASEVNQLNRIKLMLAAAKRAMKK